MKHTPQMMAIAATLWGAATVVCAAQPNQAHQCAAVSDGGERLACYDRVFPPIGSATGWPDHQAERQRALDEFGLNRQQLRRSDPVRMQVVAPNRIQATVNRLTQAADGRRIVSLDNGQTWALIEVTSKGDLKTGNTVTVREAALGSYMLVTPGGVALRAKRTR